MKHPNSLAVTHIKEKFLDISLKLTFLLKNTHISAIDCISSFGIDALFK